MLRLHHAPMACSLASRLALIEAGLAHEIAIVQTTKGEHNTPACRAINPLIADLAPDKQLFPPAGTSERANAQAWLSSLSSTLHTAMRAVMASAPGLAGQLLAYPNLDRFQQGLFSRPALAAIVGDEMRLRMAA